MLGRYRIVAIDDNVAAVPREVIDKLVAHGLAERVAGQPGLTAYGERAHVVYESGDGFIPELMEMPA